MGERRALSAARHIDTGLLPGDFCVPHYGIVSPHRSAVSFNSYLSFSLRASCSAPCRSLSLTRRIRDSASAFCHQHHNRQPTSISELPKNQKQSPTKKVLTVGCRYSVLLDTQISTAGGLPIVGCRNPRIHCNFKSRLLSRALAERYFPMIGLAVKRPQTKKDNP